MLRKVTPSSKHEPSMEHSSCSTSFLIVNEHKVDASDDVPAPGKPCITGKEAGMIIHKYVFNL
ncbi:hypothetical protein E2562_031832 [Oryza meyeriana var. granulata]|uniref:Uncharacterized protein n=1 Tax=Oryza meyeriana var. granulata TaxID=110450 RepID=A0A6G1CVM3_9ORYZ|nr:hypothetical protein E2562_031832 [Oryza meyeriana var. granulata]